MTCVLLLLIAGVFVVALSGKASVCACVSIRACVCPQSYGSVCVCVSSVCVCVSARRAMVLSVCVSARVNGEGGVPH